MILTFMRHKCIIYPVKSAHLNIHCMSFLYPPPPLQSVDADRMGRKAREGEWKVLREYFLDEWAFWDFFFPFSLLLCMPWECYITSFSVQSKKEKKVVVSRFNHELIYIILNNHERLAAFASVCADLGSLTITFLTNFSSRLPRECFYGYGLFWLCFFLPCTKLKRIFFSERDESKFVITTVTFYVHNLINTSLMLDLGTLVVIKLAANCYKN